MAADSQSVTMVLRGSEPANVTLFLRFATSLMKRHGKETTKKMRTMAGDTVARSESYPTGSSGIKNSRCTMARDQSRFILDSVYAFF